MPHRLPVKVRFGEIDSYDHVNHAVYLTYCETARVELLDDVGWSMSALESEGRRIVVADMAVRFLAAAELGDELFIETTVVETKRASSRWRQQILRDGRPIVEVELTGAIIDLEGRPARMPDGFAEALQAYQQ